MPLVAIGLLVLALGAPAAAQDCDAIEGRRVLAAGGAGPVPWLAQVARALQELEPPTVLLYHGAGECPGVESLSGTITGHATWWDAAGVQRTCALPPESSVEIAISSLDATLCGAPLPVGVVVHHGPVWALAFVVPHASRERVIAAEAAYLLYGLGAADARVAPWSFEDALYAPRMPAPTLVALSLALRIPTSRLAESTTAPLAGVIAGVAGSARPDAALGIVRLETADGARDRVRTLAYQHYGQACGHWPDATPDGFDRRNVRDGHYPLWASTRLYARGDAPEHAQRVVAWLADEADAPPGLPLRRAAITTGLVPLCAMEVMRDEALGPLYSYEPRAPCGCRFELESTGRTGCGSCASDADCRPGERCREALCERAGRSP